jgi:cytochrome c oxidase subunit 2
LRHAHRLPQGQIEQALDGQAELDRRLAVLRAVAPLAAGLAVPAYVLVQPDASRIAGLAGCIMTPSRRRRLLLFGTAAGAFCMLAPAIATPPRLIQVRAKRFEFEPAGIHVARGEAVILELMSLDVLMGFNLPDFGVRNDVMPGAMSRLPLTPDKSGEFPFHCDVFCGSGHETMSGVLIVS